VWRCSKEIHVLGFLCKNFAEFEPNELFREIAEKPELLLKLRDMFELVKAMDERPEVKKVLVDLIGHRA